MIAILMFDQYTSENMYKLISHFLQDIIYSKWYKKLIEIDTDRASSIIGALKGVTTRLENES